MKIKLIEEKLNYWENIYGWSISIFFLIIAIVLLSTFVKNYKIGYKREYLLSISTFGVLGGCGFVCLGNLMLILIDHGSISAPCYFISSISCFMIGFILFWSIGKSSEIRQEFRMALLGKKS